MRFDGTSTRGRERRQVAFKALVAYREGGIDREEEARVVDVTPHGARFLLTRPAEEGRLVRLRMPMPREYRLYDHGRSVYEVWGVVRYSKPASGPGGGGLYELGVAFIGKDAPPEYLEDPETKFDIKPVLSRAGFWAPRRLPRR